MQIVGEHALGIAGSRAGSLLANAGTMTKSTNCGVAVAGGLEAALLAARGFTGNPDVFEADKGVAQNVVFTGNTFTVYPGSGKNVVLNGTFSREAVKKVVVGTDTIDANVRTRATRTLTQNPDFNRHFEMDFAGAQVTQVDGEQHYTSTFRNNVEGAAQWPDTIANVEDGAIAVKGLEWRVAAPPGLCHY